MGKPEGKIPLGRPRLRWEDDIRMDLREVGCDPVGRPRMRWENNINHDLRGKYYTGDNWKSLAEDREVWRAYVHAAMNLRVR